MSTTTRPDQRVDVLHPLVASTVGAVTFAATMVAGDLFELNSDAEDAPATTLQDLAWYAGLVLVGFGLAVWLATRARSGTPDKLARASLGFAVASVVTFIGFWSGWPHIFAAVGVALSLEYRRRVGAFSGIAVAALAVSTACFIATSFVCLTG
jgi:signal transduction histidine kinase